VPVEGKEVCMFTLTAIATIEACTAASAGLLIFSSLASSALTSDVQDFGSSSSKSGIRPFFQKSGQVRLQPNF